MYLSELTLDPWRRDVASLLADSYALHRRLLCAFPEAANGGCGRVLFRTELAGPPRLLVQSEKRPDWHTLGALLTGCRGPKEWQPQFTVGQTLRFRLRANMTVKQDGKRRVLHGASAEETRARQAAWLARKGGLHGFALVPVPQGVDWYDPFAEEPNAAPSEVRLVPLPVCQGFKPLAEGGSVRPIAHTAVDCDGLLRVTDPTAFAEAVRAGLGPGKAFGMGLLSLARQ